MPFAHIQQGVVTDLFDADPKWPRNLTVVEVPAGTAVGWTWDGKAAAAPVPASGPRLATTYLLMRAFTDAQRAAYPTAVKPWDQRLFSARATAWPETNEKIGRIATALGTSPAAWFDAALNPAGA